MNLKGNKELINKIGFGCVSLTDASSKRKAVKRLRLVHELGVNWFDTAPLYGKGYSEKILGSFLSELPSFERDKVQVVTKFGLGHEKHVNLPVDLALILNRLKNRFLHKGNNLSNPINKKYIFNERIITLDQLQQAFFNSQKNLRTEVIYGYLAHECIFNFLTDEAKSFLYNLKSQGGIKKIGIGSNSTSILHYNKFMIKSNIDLLQYNGNDFTDIKKIQELFPDAEHIHYGIYSNSLDDLKVINPLKSHLDLFPNVRVLFSSKSLKNIRFNINYLQ
jgi:aryl-alcohol dehydrogenase-like predicted oxidoreductase